MKHIFVNETTSVSFEKALDNIYDKNHTILILSCSNDYTKDQLDPVLQKYDNNILGAIFPQIVYKGKIYTKGVIFILLDELINIKTIPNIYDRSSINNQLKNINTQNIKSVFVFADALSKKIDILTYCLYENFGLFFNYFGAGAGNINHKNPYCIISNQGLCKQCAVIGFSKLKTSLGIKHGFNSYSTNLKVTKSSLNIIKEINYNDAYEEYKNTIIAIQPKLKDNYDFNKISKNYPIAIHKLHNNIYIIRDPILTDNKTITCIGNIDENSTISIMNGDKEDILTATKEAFIEAVEQCDFDTNLTLYFAGTSRLYLLEDSIGLDIDMIAEDKKYIMGALCLGEIANIRDTVLEFHNRATVIVKVQTNE